jgi:DNA-binding CsgD family transcriptional regulator
MPDPDPSDSDANMCSMLIREEIRRLVAENVPPAEIARRLAVAPTTVDYHIARLDRPPPAPSGAVSAPAPPAREVDTRDRVAVLLAEGMGTNAIARALGLSRSTVSYHARRLGSPVDSRCARRYDWKEVQRFYDAGHSVRECQERFGFSRQTWHAAVNRGAIVARPHGLPLEELLVEGVYRSRFNLKVRIVKAGLKQKLCEVCGIASWNGERISLALHHVNGDRHDNRIENLQLLCPNCHSQTGTFAGRNGRRRADSSATAQTAERS